MTKYFPRDNAGRVNGKPVDFEDAIILAGYGRFQRRLLFTSGLCLTAVTIELLSIGHVLTAAPCDLELTAEKMRILNAMIFVGMMVSSHAWGFLADTKGRKYILIIGLLLNCLCTIVSSFSFSIWMLAGLRFLNGVFICGPSAVIFAYLGEFHSRVTRTKAIVWACSFTSLGLITASGLAWLVIPQPWNFRVSWYTYSSWKMYLLLTVVPGLLAAVLLLFCLPESPKFLLSRGRHRQALRVLQQIFTTNLGCRADQYPVTALVPDYQHNRCESRGDTSKPMVVRYIWNQTWPLFVSPHLTKMMLLCMLQFGLFSCSNGVLWMPDLFSRIAQVSSHSSLIQHTICDVIKQLQATNSEILSTPQEVICNATVEENVLHSTLIMAGGIMLGFLLTGFVINLLGKKTVLFISLLVSGCTGIAIYFVLDPNHILALGCIFVALTSTCIGVVSSTTVEEFPTNLRAMALCITLMMGHLGTMASSFLMELILDIYCNYVFFVLGGIVVVCGFLSLLLPAYSTSLPTTLIT